MKGRQQARQAAERMLERQRVTTTIHSAYWNMRAQGWLGEPVNYDLRS
jgi:hypothetical protein